MNILSAMNGRANEHTLDGILDADREARVRTAELIGAHI